MVMPLPMLGDISPAEQIPLPFRGRDLRAGIANARNARLTPDCPVNL
jgi:hypothetical protein